MTDLQSGIGRGFDHAIELVMHSARTYEQQAIDLIDEGASIDLSEMIRSLCWAQATCLLVAAKLRRRRDSITLPTDPGHVKPLRRRRGR